MNAAVASYEEGLSQALREPAEAAAYLAATLAEGDAQGFRLALRAVAAARGMTNAARAANLNRENLYHMFGCHWQSAIVEPECLAPQFGFTPISMTQTLPFGDL